MEERHRALPQPLKEWDDSPDPDDRPPTTADYEQWKLTSPEKQEHVLSQVDVFLDKFISTCQGGPTERRQMLHHLFRSIGKFFRPNIETDSLRKEMISTKNLRKGGAAWSTNKMVMGWDLDTLENQLRLMPKHERKVRAPFDTILAAAHQVSLRKWRHLLGLLRSFTPDVAGAQGMFTRIQHALRQA